MTLDFEQKPNKVLNAHIWDREKDEHYVEPAWCSARLFEEERFRGFVLDPCCGFGTIVEEAHKAGLSSYGSDIVDRGYKPTHSLFRLLNFLESEVAAENIVCNPPFNIAEKFARHACKLAEGKAALIFPTARLNAAHWLKELPLSRVWLLSPRPSMPPGYVIARGDKPGGGKMDYCWLVFDHDHNGPAQLRWLYRDRSKQT